MVIYSDAKQAQIEALKRLALKHKPTEPSERSIARHRINEILSFLDCFKPVMGQGNIHNPYYRECIDSFSSGNRVNWDALRERILADNPSYVYVR